MSPEERSAYLKSLGCRVVEPGESPQPLSIIGVQAPPEKKEPTPMKKALRLLRSRGVKINEGGRVRSRSASSEHGHRSHLTPTTRTDIPIMLESMCNSLVGAAETPSKLT